MCLCHRAQWDSRLTPKGIAQAESLRSYLAERPSGGRTFTAFDLVVVSPLTRTCETAQHIFGPARAPGTPAFACSAGPGGAPAPRVLVREECRERWGEYVCDGRRPIREIMKEFPNFDWSEVEHDEDIYYSDKREPDSECCERAVEASERARARARLLSREKTGRRALARDGRRSNDRESHSACTRA